MKTSFALAIALIAALPAQAINLLQGNRELGISGGVDFDTVDDTLVQLDLSYAYFAIDYLEFGGRVGISDSDTITTWKLGAFTEYNFYTEQPLVPYLGGSVDLAGADIQVADTKSDETAVVLGFGAGVKYFLTDSVAISTELGFDVATEDVFPAQVGAKNTNWDITFGMRFYF